MSKLFFPASRAAARQITELFDFVWPTAASLWNLRWQVAGFLDARPDATVEQLNDRFVWGSELHGTDLKKACVDTTWERQKGRFASVVLVNALAVYEAWADQMVLSAQATFTGKRLQFPDASARQGQGIESALAALTAAISPTMDAAYYPIYSASNKYSLSILPNLMLAYRYFKEVRNSEMHHGGYATTAAQTAYTRLLPHSGKADLGMRGELMFEPLATGSPVKLHLRGVVGFCDILLRIIATVDAELCRASKADETLRRYLAGSTYQPTMLSGNEKRRRQQVNTRCTRAGLPAPKDVDAIYLFLRAEKLIHV